MKSYQVEDITLKQARELSGCLFKKTGKSTLVSEKGDVELLTNAEEGFDHISSVIRFVYTQEPVECNKLYTITWCCGLFGEDDKVIMLNSGEWNCDDLEVCLVKGFETILSPTSRLQAIRFAYKLATWELVILQNFRSTQYLLRRVLVNPNRMGGYFPVFNYEQPAKQPNIYPVIEQFKDQLIQFYTPE